MQNCRYAGNCWVWAHHELLENDIPMVHPDTRDSLFTRASLGVPLAIRPGNSQAMQPSAAQAFCVPETVCRRDGGHDHRLAVSARYFRRPLHFGVVFALWRSIEAAPLAASGSDGVEWVPDGRTRPRSNRPEEVCLRFIF